MHTSLATRLKTAMPRINVTAILHPFRVLLPPVILLPIASEIHGRYSLRIHWRGRQGRPRQDKPRRLWPAMVTGKGCHHYPRLEILFNYRSKVYDVERKRDFQSKGSGDIFVEDRKCLTRFADGKIDSRQARCRNDGESRRI
jgi:hypothetical protein